MVKELHADENQRYRLFRQFSVESRAVVIASVALIAAILALLMSWIAMYDSISARAKVELHKEMQNAQLEAMGRRLDMQDAKIWVYEKDDEE